jgi:hypothetical protein
VNFVDANNWMFANALGPLVAKNPAKWFNSRTTTWGKNDGGRAVLKSRGRGLGELMVPQGTATAPSSCASAAQARW